MSNSAKVEKAGACKMRPGLKELTAVRREARSQIKIQSVSAAVRQVIFTIAVFLGVPLVARQAPGTVRRNCGHSDSTTNDPLPLRIRSPSRGAVAMKRSRMSAPPIAILFGPLLARSNRMPG